MILILFIVPFSLFSNFIGMNYGTRAYGMGNAYVALADEPSAIFWNPAGIAKIDKLSLAVSHQNLFGLNDLYNEMAAISVPTKFVDLAFGWTQQNLLHTYYEQILYLTSARKIEFFNIPFYLGVNLKYLSAHADYENVDSPSAIDTDFGLIIEPISHLCLGFSGKNLAEPSFSFLDSSDSLLRNFTLGTSYNWKNTVNFLADYYWDKNGGQWNIGGEMWFYDVFAPRIGISGENLTVGFGIKTKNWNLDGAVYSHDELGSTYRIGLGLKLDVLEK